MTLVKDLFIRQDKLVYKCNDYLYNKIMKLKNELLILDLDNGIINQCLIDAAKLFVSISIRGSKKVQ